MPAKNIVKIYIKNGYYHLYNRGVEKRKIFSDNQDYKVFLSYLKIYLTPPPKDQPLKRLSNHAKEISLLAYCLMPNHFHLLVKQRARDGINYFMRSLATKYSIYFNKKHKRVGPLFQGRYKAVNIETDEQLLHLSRYIHTNPSDLISARSNLAVYPYSSYKNYLGKINQLWVKPQEVLNFFSNKNSSLSYKAFVSEKEILSPAIENLTID